jgi:hypothetical protein
MPASDDDRTSGSSHRTQAPPTVVGGLIRLLTHLIQPGQAVTRPTRESKTRTLTRHVTIDLNPDRTQVPIEYETTNVRDCSNASARPLLRFTGVLLER